MEIKEKNNKMKELNFKEKFPELSDSQVKQLQRELLELIGPDIDSDPHVTRDYNRDDYARDQVNGHKKAIRSRLQTYLHDTQPTDHKDK